MARGCWANFPAAAADAGLEKQKKQRFVALGGATKSAA